MTDFREQIEELKASYKKSELIDVLAEELGERTTSVNPITEAMFDRIAPNHQPLEYARKVNGYSEDAKPVAKNAMALKILLHEQVGRPLYLRVLRLKKQDFAECIAAVDAYDQGIERGPQAHVPTTLPLGIDELVTDPPTRTQPTEPLFDPLVEMKSGFQTRLSTWLEQNPAVSQSPYFVYALDCTPELGDNEPRMVQEMRRVVQAKMNAGESYWDLEIEEQAAAELNNDNRVYYVGSTGDIEKRINEHHIGTAVSGVNFTTNHPPTSIGHIRGCSTEAEARRLEGELAHEINEHEGLFAYSDEM